MDTNKNWKKNIVLFLAGQTISLFGSSLVQYAIMWYITLKTQSGGMMTISILCGFLPTFFLSPFAGVWADRYNRKMLIVLSDSMIAMVTLILAIVFMAGYNAVWLLFVASALRAFGSGVQTPAVSAFLPQIVPQEKLTKVNAANSTIQSFVFLISPMLAGALLTFASIEAIFFIDVVTAAIAVFIVFAYLHVPAHTKAQSRQTTGYFADLKSGIKYIGNHAFLKTFFLICAVFFFLVSPVAFLTPLQVARSFGSDVWRLTAIEITFSAGTMAGGLMMASWGGFQNKMHTMIAAALIMGAFTFALGVTSVFWLYLVFMALVGFSMPMFSTPSTVMLQQKVEPDYLGRVFGVFSMISSITMPLGMLVFGPVADFMKIEWMLIATGIPMFVTGLFLFGNRVLLAAGKPEPEGE